MRKFSGLFILALIACFLVTPGCCHSLSSADDKIVTNLLPNPNNFVKSTVMLQVRGKVVIKLGKDVTKQPTGISASGVAIDKKHILTAGHFCEPVVSGQSKEGITSGIAKIFFKKNIEMYYLNTNEEVVKMNGAKIIAWDKEKDICLVELRGHGIIPAKIAAPSSIRRGDKVYIVGAPLGVAFTKTEGEVAIPSIQFEEKEAAHVNGRILVTAPATNGNSGGPCFNERGEIIGVVMAGADGYDHLTILTPSKYILSFLKKVHKD